MKDSPRDDKALLWVDGYHDVDDEQASSPFAATISPGVRPLERNAASTTTVRRTSGSRILGHTEDSKSTTLRTSDDQLVGAFAISPPRRPDEDDRSLPPPRQRHRDGDPHQLREARRPTDHLEVLASAELVQADSDQEDDDSDDQQRRASINRLDAMENPSIMLVEASRVDPTKTRKPDILKWFKARRSAQVIASCVALSFIALLCGMIYALTRSTRSRRTSTPPSSDSSNDFDTHQARLDQVFQESLPLELLELQKVKSTPQHSARSWIDVDTGSIGLPDNRLRQRFTLAVLFYSTAGPTEWDDRGNWLSADHECNWSPMYEAEEEEDELHSCENDMIRSITLNSNGLKGTVPVEISLLSAYLEFLDLGDNDLSGTFPSFFGQMDLQTLALQSNNFHGAIPEELYDATGLVVLILTENALEGTISTRIGQFKELEAFDIDSNLFTGTIPTEIALTTSLQEFVFFENEIRGPLPSEIGLLSDLNVLLGYSNTLTGTLPTEWGKLTLLEGLNLSNNEGIQGTIPVEYKHLGDIGEFIVAVTGMSTVVPPEVCEVWQEDEVLIVVPCDDDDMERPAPTDCSCCSTCDWSPEDKHEKGTDEGD